LKDNFTGELMEVTDNGTYSFNVNDAGSASAERFDLIISPDGVTSVKGNISGKGVVIYPNPVSSSTFTIASKNLSGKVSIEILDMLGRKVNSKTVESLGSNAEIKIAKPSVAGQYSVRISDAKGTVVKSLIVK